METPQRRRRHRRHPPRRRRHRNRNRPVHTERPELAARRRVSSLHRGASPPWALPLLDEFQKFVKRLPRVRTRASKSNVGARASSYASCGRLHVRDAFVVRGLVRRARRFRAPRSSARAAARRLSKSSRRRPRALESVAYSYIPAARSRPPRPVVPQPRRDTSAPTAAAVDESRGARERERPIRTRRRVE